MRREIKKAAKYLAFSFGDHLEVHLCELLERGELGEFLENAGLCVAPNEQEELIEEAKQQVHRIKEFLGVCSNGGW